MFFTIKDIAYYFNNTKGAIRFYEEKGLLNPNRDLSGNRQYSYNDLLQLFYLKRYCQLGYSINDTNSYFSSDNNNELTDIEKLISLKKEETEREIKYYEMRLKLLNEYGEKIKKCIAGNSELELIDIDAFYSIDIENFLTADKNLKKILKDWINAMPQTKIIVNLLSNNLASFNESFRIGIIKSTAEQLGLDIPPITELIPESKAFYTIIEACGDDFSTDCTQKVSSLCKEISYKGYTLSKPPSYTLIFSNSLNNVKKKYFEVYIPIEN